MLEAATPQLYSWGLFFVLNKKEGRKNSTHAQVNAWSQPEWIPTILWENFKMFYNYFMMAILSCLHWLSCMVSSSYGWWLWAYFQVALDQTITLQPFHQFYFKETVEDSRSLQINELLFNKVIECKRSHATDSEILIQSDHW